MRKLMILLLFERGRSVQKEAAPLLQVRFEIQEHLHCLRWRRLSLAGSSENKLQPAFISFVRG